MRRLGLVLAMCGLFVVSSPAPARAMSWWALEKLSGPAFRSKYWPPSIEARLLCLNRQSTTDQDGKPKIIETQSAGFLFSFCNAKAGQRRYASLDIGLNFARSDPDALFAGGKQIDWNFVSTSFSFHIAGPLEVGSAFNVNRFSSEGFREPFWNVSFEPVRVDLRPFHLSDVDWMTDKKLYWLREVLVLRTGWIMFPAFSAGQLNSQISLGREAAMYTGVFFDLDTILRKATNKW